jgi:hypothetical protein
MTASDIGFERLNSAKSAQAASQRETHSEPSALGRAEIARLGTAAGIGALSAYEPYAFRNDLGGTRFGGWQC